ncbi:hypothetical protein E2I00_018503, partial [Balaenoptera physalus]
CGLVPPKEIGEPQEKPVCGGFPPKDLGVEEDREQEEEGGGLPPVDLSDHLVFTAGGFSSSDQILSHDTSAPSLATCEGRDGAFWSYQLAPNPPGDPKDGPTGSRGGDPRALFWLCLPCRLADDYTPAPAAFQGLSLSSHMALLHSRNSCKTLKCPKCNWHYKYQQTLDPYRCDVCNYSTTTKGNLSIHMQSDKHLANLQGFQAGPGGQGSPPEAVLPPPAGDKEPKTKASWQCKVCSYETNISRNLRIHMTSEKHMQNVLMLHQGLPLGLPPGLVFRCLVCQAFSTDSLELLLYHCSVGRSLPEAEWKEVAGDTHRCKLCCYGTQLKANFQLHLKTDKHAQKYQLAAHLREGSGAMGTPSPVPLGDGAPYGSVPTLHLRCNICDFESNSKEKMQLHARGAAHEENSQIYKTPSRLAVLQHLRAPAHRDAQAQRRLQLLQSGPAADEGLSALQGILSFSHGQLQPPGKAPVTPLAEPPTPEKDAQNKTEPLASEEAENKTGPPGDSADQTTVFCCPYCSFLSPESEQATTVEMTLMTKVLPGPALSPLGDGPETPAPGPEPVPSRDKAAAEAPDKPMGSPDQPPSPALSPAPQPDAQADEVAPPPTTAEEEEGAGGEPRLAEPAPADSRHPLTYRKTTNFALDKFLDPARPYKCTVCKESFTQKNILLVHYNSVSHLHKMKKAAVDPSGPARGEAGAAPAPAATDKPFKCTVCRVSYNQSSTLEIHMRSVLHQTRSRGAKTDAKAEGPERGPEEPKEGETEGEAGTEKKGPDPGGFISGGLPFLSPPPPPLDLHRFPAPLFAPPTHEEHVHRRFLPFEALSRYAAQFRKSYDSLYPPPAGTKFTEFQTQALQSFFETSAYPKDGEVERLASLLGLASRVVVVWFQNARQKARKSAGDGGPVPSGGGTGGASGCRRCRATFSCVFDLDSNPTRKMLDCISEEVGLKKRVVQDEGPEELSKASPESEACSPSAGDLSDSSASSLAEPESPGAGGTNGGPGGGAGVPDGMGQRRYRTQMSSLQLKIMKACYEAYRTPTMQECEVLGEEIGLPKRVIQVWFQNARAKEKKAKLQGAAVGGAGGSSEGPLGAQRTDCPYCDVKYDFYVSCRGHLFSRQHLAKLKEAVRAQLKSESKCYDLAPAPEAPPAPKAPPATTPASVPLGAAPALPRLAPVLLSGPALAQPPLGSLAPFSAGPAASSGLLGLTTSVLPATTVVQTAGPGCPLPQRPMPDHTNTSTVGTTDPAPGPPTEPSGDKVSGERKPAAAPANSSTDALKNLKALKATVPALLGGQFLPFPLPSAGGATPPAVFGPQLQGAYFQQLYGMKKGLFPMNPVIPQTLIGLLPNALLQPPPQAPEPIATAPPKPPEQPAPAEGEAGEADELLTGSTGISTVDVTHRYLCRQCKMAFDGEALATAHQRSFCFFGRGSGGSMPPPLRVPICTYHCLACEVLLSGREALASHLRSSAHRRKAAPPPGGPPGAATNAATAATAAGQYQEEEVEMILAVFALNQSLYGDGLRYPILN